MLMYGIVAILSGTYASHPTYAAWKGIEIVVDVLISAAVLSSSKPAAAVEKLFWLAAGCCMILLGSVWLGALLSPGQAFLRIRGIVPLQLSGVFPPINPNSVGFISAFVLLATIGDYRKSSAVTRRVINLLMILGATAGLFLAQSRTSIVSFLIAVLAWSFFSGRKRIFLAIVVVGGMALAMSTLRDGLINYMERGQQKAHIENLSGRTVGWNIAWERFKEAPFMGHGLGSAGRFDILQGNAVATLHGSIFEVLVGVGGVGFFCWFMGIASITVSMIKSIFLHRGGDMATSYVQFRALSFSVMILLLVKILTSSSLAFHEIPFLIMMIMACLAYPLGGRQ